MGKIKEKGRFGKLHIPPIVIIIFVALTVGLPRLIDYLYLMGSPNGHPNTEFTASDVLLYSGTILAMIGTIIGVFISIRYAQAEYHDDTLKRVLPYIIKQDVCLKYRDTIFEDNCHGDETFIEKVYLVIDSDGYRQATTLTSDEKKDITFGPIDIDWENICNHKIKRLYQSMLLNVGIGTAINCVVCSSKVADDVWQPSNICISLLPQQKIYFGILVDSRGEDFDFSNDKYLIEISYSDIFGTNYKQQWSICLFNNGYVEWTSIRQQIDEE